MKPPAFSRALCIAQLPSRTRWRRTYATDTSAEPAWFEAVRTEMLARKYPLRAGCLFAEHAQIVAQTLADALPHDGLDETVRLVSHNQLLFNAHTSEAELLPDGCDRLHSPGGPFTRRLWTGGSVGFYSDYQIGPQPFYGKRFLCSERIKDVQLRGQDAAAKVFVTIERRFRHTRNLGREAHLGPIYKGGSTTGHLMTTGTTPFEDALCLVLQDKNHEALVWKKASIVEERHLVFMRGHEQQELEKFASGRFPPVKYAKPMNEPEFSHKFTPTDALLFRWSALTWNAHKIHLDHEYARHVEGHRNLLVHGPLTLTLMLGLVVNHLKGLPGSAQQVHAIEYRNLAPLYANEELRLCGRLRSTKTEGTAVYDVWIEGPTGGMAAKATVRTVETLPENPEAIMHREIVDRNRTSARESKPRIARTRQSLQSSEESATSRISGQPDLPAGTSVGGTRSFSTMSRVLKEGGSTGRPQQDSASSAAHFDAPNELPKVFTRAEKRRAFAKRERILAGLPPPPSKEELSKLPTRKAQRKLYVKRMGYVVDLPGRPAPSPQKTGLSLLQRVPTKGKPMKPPIRPHHSTKQYNAPFTKIGARKTEPVPIREVGEKLGKEVKSRNSRKR